MMGGGEDTLWFWVNQPNVREIRGIGNYDEFI